LLRPRRSAGLLSESGKGQRKKKRDKKKPEGNNVFHVILHDALQKRTTQLLNSFSRKVG
jgi:hypothetical protein